MRISDIGFTIKVDIAVKSKKLNVKSLYVV